MDVSSRPGMMISFNVAEVILVACRDISAGKSNQYIMPPYPIFTCKKPLFFRADQPRMVFEQFRACENPTVRVHRTPPYSLILPHKQQHPHAKDTKN